MDQIERLVTRFGEHVDQYKNGSYNETQLRRDFLDPFFEALGWDVFNKKGRAESYREVIHEDSIKVGNATKAPDYCFRIGEVRKFFVEAKKPSVNIKDDISPAFQVRRYAWSAKLPLSILTDFEEFAVYDCRIKPVKTDKASTGRVMYFTFREYLDRWDEISGIFSREAIYKGSFDKFAQSHKKKRGTAEVDDEFLAELETWRKVLAQNMALRNPALTQRELNHAVQLTIDRLVFLRICEDRGIEDYGRLQSLINGANAYPRLLEYYRQADEKYNSGLFHFDNEKGRQGSPDTLTPGLSIDDKPLKEILKKLYYPDSPYVFSEIPADILGQAYERFLGKVIRLTAGHQAKVEEKPEVRKAGGVYYTPTYIVDYIVKNTVGKLLEDKTPKQASKLKVLDPACGSGSFLLGAYQFLLDWHIKWYAENDPEKHAKGKNPAIYESQGGWRLTTAEKKRILLNNIHGVDIDTQAVEVTKLSLLLKVLEGETSHTLTNQMKMFHERALPDLRSNIKCGNSLISHDYYHGKPHDALSEEEHFRLNAFDWHGAEGFPAIMKGGGFDAVIGNPPYVRQESLGDLKEYFQKHYETYQGTADLYVYFIERAHQLLRMNGLFGYIVSNKWMRANYGKSLRDFISTKATLQQIVDFGELPVFQNAATFPAIVLTRNETPKDANFIYAPIKRLDFTSLQEEVASIKKELDARALEGVNWTLASTKELDIMDKMRSLGSPLGEYVDGKIYRGVLTGLNEAFVINAETKDSLIKEDPKSAEIIKPFVVGNDIRKYRINYQGKYLIFTRRGINIDEYPAIKDYLLPYKEQLIPKPKDWKGIKWKGRKPGPYQWYEVQDTIEYYNEFDKPKIAYPDISKESRLTLDTSGYFYGNTVYFIPIDDKFLLGILNSKIIFYYYKYNAAILGDANKGGRLRWFSQDVMKLPIRTINFDDAEDKARHDRMVEMVESMLSLNKRLAKAKTDHERNMLQRQIDHTDRQIDTLVYELYDLTPDEIKIVEGESN